MKRIFLITGASKGIGHALSHRLAEQGHAIVGIARNASEGFPGAFHPLDLADPSSGDRLAPIIRETEVDGVINNVGLVRTAPMRRQAHPNLRDFVAFKYSVARCSKKLARATSSRRQSHGRRSITAPS
jgi:3-oxoacyl-[acyl-carrier protein] reductase